jgi:hypothetical protein
MKRAFTIVWGLAFLLVCLPAMAETVSGPGYAGGSVGSYTYDPYTGQASVQWSTAYGVNPYGNPATTTTTATETRGQMGVMINSHNETANGRSYAAGGSTDASSYSDDCREEVTEEVNTATSSIDVCGTSEFFLEAWTESAHTSVDIAEAAGKIEVLHAAANAEGDQAQVSFMATEVRDYFGGAAADADIAKAGHEFGAGENVSAVSEAQNAQGDMASSSIEADELSDFEQWAGVGAWSGGVQTGLRFGAGGNVTAVSETQNAQGDMASSSIEAAQLSDFKQGVKAWDDRVKTWQNFGAGENVTAVGEAQNVEGDRVSASIEADQLSDFEQWAGVRAWGTGVQSGQRFVAGENVNAAVEAQSVAGEMASTTIKADQLSDFDQYAGIGTWWSDRVSTGLNFSAGENVTAVSKAQDAAGDMASTSIEADQLSVFHQYALTGNYGIGDGVYTGQRFESGANVTAVGESQNAEGGRASSSIEAEELDDFAQYTETTTDWAHTWQEFSDGVNVTAVVAAQNAQGDWDNASATGDYSGFRQWANAWADNVNAGQDWN